VTAVSDPGELGIKGMTRLLAAIAHSLESAVDPSTRVREALGHCCQLLAACDRCALLRKVPPASHELYVSSDVTPEERMAIEQRLERAFQIVAGDDDVSQPGVSDGHLTLPVMGLGEVIGVISASPLPGEELEARHVQMLSIVAAQIGAYFALLTLHAEQEAQKRDLAVANEIQRNLTGIVSHDLRTPLSVIVVVAESLLARATDPAEVRALERALRNAERANRIIHDLLDVTQARVTGGITIQPVALDLRALVADVVEDQRTQHVGRTITLDDRAGGTVIGQWDPDRLSQVLSNLIGNAVAHGDRTRPISVTLAASGERARIEVHNHGPEIPPGARTTLFDPFTRLERRRARGGGIGLGLYIVDQIVRAHGGHVACSSDATTGTTFVVDVPRRTMHDGAALDAVATRRPGSRPLIMVVDDEDDSRDSIAETLEAQGYDVVVAANGAEALAQLRRGTRPSLMLVDMNMPVMDGEALCDACSADPELASIPLLAVTGDAAAAFRASRHSLAGVLLKPFRTQALVDTVSRVVH
jgi:signal transduction histidine kinase